MERRTFLKRLGVAPFALAACAVAGVSGWRRASAPMDGESLMPVPAKDAQPAFSSSGRMVRGVPWKPRPGAGVTIAQGDGTGARVSRSVRL